ncbi:MAG: TetR/AcrR family transcriptional regulator [Nevskia sp.]|nr:TetR/AcrR family transcriptional regulator [Nevskia sp.]
MKPATITAPRSPDRRRAILEAALQCFVRRGYAVTTIDDVLRGSGASVGSVYHHFGSKERIAAELYVEALRDYQHGFLAALEQARDAESGVRGMSVYHLGWVRDHADQARFLFQERPPEVEQAAAAELREMNRHFFRRVQDWLDVQVEAGAIRPLPRELFHVIVIGPCQELSRHWLAGRMRIDIKLAQRELGEAAWAALRRRSGP